MGGIADILRKSLKPGVPRVPCVPDSVKHEPEPLSGISGHGTCEKSDGVPRVPSKKPDPVLGHLGHEGKNPVSHRTASENASNDAISDLRDKWDTWDTSKTHIPEKRSDTINSAGDVPSPEIFPYKPDLSVPFEDPCIVHDPDMCGHPRCIDRRIGGLGEPLDSNGQITGAFEKDEPHIRLYAWCLANLSVGQDVSLNIGQAASECRLTDPEAREAMSKLVKGGDVVITRSRQGDLFRLRIQYWKEEIP